MTSETTARNRARVQEIYAAYCRGDLPFLLGALAEDVRWISGEQPLAAPWCGIHQGREGVEAYFAALGSECTIVAYHVDRVIADGDWAAVTARARVRYNHSGAEREVSKVDVLRLHDGQVAEFREFYDTSQVAADLQRQN